MITAKRLVLLLLTGLLMASIACGAVSSVNPFSATPVPTYDSSKPRPTDTPWPTLPADYFKKTPIPTVGYIKKQGNTPTPIPTPIAQYGDLYLTKFKLSRDEVNATVVNKGNSRGKVCVIFDVYKGNAIVATGRIPFEVPAGVHGIGSTYILDGNRIQLFKFTKRCTD